MNSRSTARIVTFVAVSYGWAWAWWAASIVLLTEDPSSPVAPVTSFVGTCAPAIAAWMIWWRAEGAREAWRRVGNALVPAGPWLAWLLPALAIVATVAIASLAQQRWGGAVPPAPSMWLVVPLLLLMLVAGGGQEEIGWRGWLQPALNGRLGRWGAAIAVGLIWFAWHLPLFWTPGAIQAYIPMPAFAMTIVGLSLLMARILESTRGRPAVAMWLHALNNLVAAWLIFVTPEDGAAQPGSWVVGSAYLLVGVVAMLIRRRPLGSTRENRVFRQGTTYCRE